MIDMKCPIKCPICGEMLQKYGEVDPDAGTSIVLGANCRKCGIGNSDIKLWQELVKLKEEKQRTSKALEMTDTDLAIIVTNLDKVFPDMRLVFETIRSARKRIAEIITPEQKDVK